MDNISLTQRIVGAIVILSLAIIFIPALLETDRLAPGKAIDSPIPEVPREISTIVFQLNESNGKFEGEGLVADAGEAPGSGNFTPSERLNREVAEAIENSADEIEMVDPSDGAGSSADADGDNSKANRQSSPAPAKTETKSLNESDDGSQHSWMLQLASFKDEQNAIKLRDSLRAKQYVANVDERKFSSGSIWRVRIGPVLSKEKIVKIQAMLEKEMKMKGLIIRRR